MTDSQSKRPTRILMVDDDAVLRTSLGLMLSRAGYEVGHASNGKEAVAMHLERSFDIVITEVAMPEADGLEALAKLRKLLPPVKFIAISKENRITAALCLRMAGQLGARYVLTKPFPPEQLLAAVGHVLGET